MATIYNKNLKEKQNEKQTKIFKRGTFRAITAIEKEIKKVEDRRLEYCRTPRSSSGAYSQANINFSHKLRILNNELERAKSFKALNG